MAKSMALIAYNGLLPAAPTRIGLGTGSASAEELCARATVAPGDDAVVFQGGPTGFLDGEFGMTGEPRAFAAVLRGVLEPHEV
ncbi:hypothetical protein [Nocardia sp. NPDC019395]|uniref:hypothetical protein n=1 Tax=Nocardia sp. NPDC019395 TaxID=3154686 RepID=UPI0033F41D97